MQIRVEAKEGDQLSTICRQLKMNAEDGKQRLTDTANVEGIFRIIQLGTTYFQKILKN